MKSDIVWCQFNAVYISFMNITKKLPFTIKCRAKIWTLSVKVNLCNYVTIFAADNEATRISQYLIDHSDPLVTRLCL